MVNNWHLTWHLTLWKTLNLWQHQSREQKFQLSFYHNPSWYGSSVPTTLLPTPVAQDHPLQSKLSFPCLQLFGIIPRSYILTFFLNLQVMSLFMQLHFRCWLFTDFSQITIHKQLSSALQILFLSSNCKYSQYLKCCSFNNQCPANGSPSLWLHQQKCHCPTWGNLLFAKLHSAGRYSPPSNVLFWSIPSTSP